MLPVGSNEIQQHFDRQYHCRIFYDGTNDDVYSNFKSFKFALGRLGFAKGEQFYHVAKALVCQDYVIASQMMITTGGPALRKLGRQVQNYPTHGQEWENVDTGWLLLVCLIIKLAQLQSLEEKNMILHNELASDEAAAESSSHGYYIAEGAMDDTRCGIGIHATDPAILEKMKDWGRNQLGHVCMAMVFGWDFSKA